MDKYVDEIMNTGGCSYVFSSLSPETRDKIKQNIRQQIRKAQREVLEEILAKPLSITAYNWEGYVHNSVIQSKINQLKEEQINE